MSPLIHPQQLGAALHDEDICPQEFMFGLHSFESPLLPPPPHSTHHGRYFRFWLRTRLRLPTPTGAPSSQQESWSDNPQGLGRVHRPLHWGLRKSSPDTGQGLTDDRSAR